MKRSDVTPALIREFLDCDYETGRLTWRIRDRKHYAPTVHGNAARNRFNARFAGQLAFQTVDSISGYRSSTIFGVSVLAHLVVWCHYHGRWPNEHIDHIHGVEAGDGIANLREATPEQNSRNMKMRADHPTGVYGVRETENGKWMASISIGKGRMKSLGRFVEFADAVAARKAAEPLHGYGPRHGLAC